MSEEMTMTKAEAIQELKRIDKQVDRLCARITRYSSKVAVLPDEIERQQAQVDGWKQAVGDLLDRYTKIRLALNASNLVTTFVFKEREYSIAKAILYKQYLALKYTKLMESFNDSTAQKQLGRMSVSGIPSDKMEAAMIVPKLFYKEDEINQAKDALLELMAHLDAKIDASNHATTITI